MPNQTKSKEPFLNNDAKVSGRRTEIVERQNERALARERERERAKAEVEFIAKQSAHKHAL